MRPVRVKKGEFMLRKRYQCLLIAFVVLAVFYPSLSTQFCRLDDQDMVSGIKAMTGWSLKGLFMPGATGGLYYRPLVIGSFIVDKYCFDMDARLMHLENVLLPSQVQ